MSPITHLLASWLIAAKTTDNPRDCRLVALAGILPDTDGLGLAVDTVKNLIHHTSDYFYYGEYHHWVMHGAFGALLTSGVLAIFARHRWRVFLLCLLVFHLHLFCDLIGARGPTPDDLWPIIYLGPFSHRVMWVWHGQWQLDGWQNRVITGVLFIWAMCLASTRNDSFVGVFNRRADAAFISVLKKWRGALIAKFKSSRLEKT